MLADRPTNDWTPKLVAKLWKGRAALTLREVAALKVDARDRLFLILEHFLDDRRRRLLACDLAEQALATAGDASPVCVEAIRVARAYAHGEASADRMEEARGAVWEENPVSFVSKTAVHVARLCASNACGVVKALPELRPFHTGNNATESAVMANLHNLGIVTRWTYPWGEFPGKVPGAPTAESVRNAAIKRAVEYAEEEK